MGFYDDFAEGMDTLSPQSIKETITTTKKTNKMSNIAKAIIAVMKAVKGIEKNSTVGKGTNSAYQGVSDKDVKEVYSKAMAENGLCILPIGIEDDVQVSRWEEKSNYGTKQKQSIFCSVKTKYLLLHVSGESQEISGYGHGVDSQDKAAGKATTYALKYALLYTFMTPTGKIDDSDNTHSENIETPQTTKQKPPYPVARYPKGAMAIFEGKTTIEQIQETFTVSETAKAVIMANVLNIQEKAESEKQTIK